MHSALEGELVSVTGVRGAGFEQTGIVSGGGPVHRRVKSRGLRVPHVTRSSQVSHSDEGRPVRGAMAGLFHRLPIAIFPRIPLPVFGFRA